MASSSDDQPKRDQTETRPAPTSTGNTNTSQSPPPQPPPAMGYPPTVGYPHGHPGYPTPYQGYPQNGYNGYPYAQPPPAAYYTNQTYQTQNGSGFVRGIIAAMILLVIVMCITSLMTWLILRPEIPSFRLETFSVSNFNVSKTGYAANWEANVTVENMNQKLKLYLDRIQSFVDYKDDTLSTSFVEPFSLETKARTLMLVKLGSNNSGQPVDLGQVEDMGKQRESGKVTFDLRFIVWSTLRTSSWWTRHIMLRVFCEDLDVIFVGANSNDGVLSNGKPRNCLVYA